MDVNVICLINNQANDREDIHPAEVLERLASVEAKKPAVPTLPPAVPDADPDRPVRALRIRTRRVEPLP